MASEYYHLKTQVEKMKWDKARKVVDAIIADIAMRKSFSGPWENIGKEGWEDIKDRWTLIAMETLY